VAARDECLALLGAAGLRPHRVRRDGTCAPADEASAVRARGGGGPPESL